MGRRANHFALSEMCQAPPNKNIPLPFFVNLWLIVRHPGPARGAYASSRTWAGDAMDACGISRRVMPCADGQAAWSRPPDAGGKPARRLSRATVANTPGHRGERGAAVKTIARGMPVVPAEPVLLACASVQFPCTQGSRVRPASGIPCALSSSRVSYDATLGQFVSREGESMSVARMSVATSGTGPAYRSAHAGYDDRE